MGEDHTYRYVNTNGVPNSNSGEYAFPANDTGAKKDLGATNTYRYVTATNVYNKGKADGATVHTGTYTASSRSDALDMGASHTYRYVKTSGIGNTNSGTYTYAANSTGETVDMGAANTYRYVNASNVYTKGYNDGKGGKTATFTSSTANQWIDVNVGFSPSIVICIMNYASQGANYAIIVYDKHIQTSKFIAASWNSGASWGDLTGVGGTYFMFKLIANGFSIVSAVAGSHSYTYTAIP